MLQWKKSDLIGRLDWFVLQDDGHINQVILTHGRDVVSTDEKTMQVLHEELFSILERT